LVTTEKPLHTLLHISDLHFGVPAASASGGTPPTKWRHLECTDGWLGHNDSALAHLEDYALDLADENPTLLVTGDLTACGKVDEFKLATAYLTQTITLRFRETGLGVPDALSRSISGNHDQWPGSIRVVGRATDGLTTTFTEHPPFPFAPVTIPLTKRRQLSIYGIDSDADVFAFGIKRAFARGRFLSQLQALASMIGPRSKNEIRVLLLHHSPAYSTGLKLVIDDESVKALWGFVKQHHISVLLTGHIHRPLARVRHVSHKDAQWHVLEARCGTTTQTDEMPLNWIAKGTDDPQRFPRNSLLVHRLFDTGAKIEWRTDLIWRRHSGYSAAVPLTRPVAVWP
jgi:3',5'-cyclic AMP phosphodiesterase CpdA